MFEIKDKFYLDGKEFKIISGAFHYFRTVPEYWQDRLEKLRNMGCNTVETYIPWNFHEPKRGEFLWEGMRDICRFIETARKLGLYIIIRPSPYICAEWEFGGLPAWLLKDRGMRLRCSYKPYLDAVESYYNELMPKLAPYQIDRGGNIIMMQLENEYGYYGSDKAYLKFLSDTMRRLGITVPFVTSDGPWNDSVFRCGMAENALATGNFGSSVKWQFDTMQSIIGQDKPLMCMEFWCGWFDAWGEEHHTFDVSEHMEQYTAELDEIMRRGSVNFYMFEGGTNFGFMSGRNGGSKTPDVTSYDYDAMLTEDGRITPKYEAVRKIFSNYFDIPRIPLTADIKRKEYGSVKCSGKTDLFSVLDKISSPVHSVYPLTMEELDQNYGYILYRVKLGDDDKLKDIRLEGMADRAQGFAEGELMFTAFDSNIYDKFECPREEQGGSVDILVENLSRENFGTGLESQRKGISGGIVINDSRRYGMDIYPLPLDEKQIADIDFESGCKPGAPAFYRFELDIDEPCDTFLDFGGFEKGCAFINGFNLGRFWGIGPQKRLYLPAPLLRKGKNTIILFETEGKAADEITLCGEPSL